MSVTIQILEGEPEQGNKLLTLEKTTILIGRGEDQDVRLTNDSVSGRHCVLEKREGQWRVIDEESHNGTFVNGQRVPKQRVLRHEDVLELGEVMLRVGLDRKLRGDGPHGIQPTLPIIVRAISAVAVLVVLCLASTSMYFLWKYQQEMSRIVSRLPVTLGPVQTRAVFEMSPEQSTLTFQTIKTFPGWIELDPQDLSTPCEEWDYNDVWSTQKTGQEPRLFEGLDLDLPGNVQAVASGYFFCRRTLEARDASDPFGKLIFELEGWSGLGARYANAEAIPAIRAPELPHYVKGLEIYPERLKEESHADWTGVQVAELSWQDHLWPPYPGAENAALLPPRTENIITLLMPKPQARDVQFEGKICSFFKDGNRYTLTVRGTGNLFARFEGGLDAVVKAFVDSVKIETPGKREVPAPETLQKEIKLKSTMLVASSRRPIVVDALTYTDLKQIRDLLLALQQTPKPGPGEDELRHLYFMIRNRSQKELTISAAKIYDGRLFTKSVEGERELMRIRQFMSDYPPLTLKWGQPGYPEWGMYYESVVDVNPYTTLKSTVRRR